MVIHYNYFRIENNNNYDLDNSNKLFFKLWRNVIVRNEILENIKKFKAFENSSIVYVNDSYAEDEKRFFLKKVKIIGNSSKDIIEKLSYLPHTVEELTIEYKTYQHLPISKKENTFFIQPFIKTLILESHILNPMVPFNFIPPTIKRLKLPNYFNHPLKIKTYNNNNTTTNNNNIGYQSIFPKNSCLEFIDFGYTFNKKLSDLPKTLKSIKLSRDFNLKLKKNSIPNNVREIEFKENYSKLIPYNSLPPYVKVSSTTSTNKTLQINKAHEKLFIPHWISKLILGERFKVELLPDLTYLNIRYISLNCKGFSDLSNLSRCKSIKTLKFGENFSQAISIKDLPPKLYSLFLPKSFYQTITNSLLPRCLGYLYLKSDNIDIEFPLGRRSLIIYISKNNQTIINKIKENPKLIGDSVIHLF
ncbi:hypothetical protein RB653_008755 [Dictyostelium firmibasis]|uniref:FNIP repeat-containing protein n=1 Tax=Dictyostelium firmibasis TaxID=79012 RepID=A0AAN7YRT6_9MYCE